MSPHGLHEVYPRVCGGTPCEACLSVDGDGLSPRVRGNLIDAARGQGPARSIPACAGEPILAPPSSNIAKVYPRVCGGTAKGIRERELWLGLSPRVRGNQPLGRDATHAEGSIPACAGEPAVP